MADDHLATGGSFFHSVDRVKRHGHVRYRLRMRFDGKRVSYGVFDTRSAARKAFNAATTQLSQGITPTRDSIRAKAGNAGKSDVLSVDISH